MSFEFGPKYNCKLPSCPSLNFVFSCFCLMQPMVGLLQFMPRFGNALPYSWIALSLSLVCSLKELEQTHQVFSLTQQAPNLRVILHVHKFKLKILQLQFMSCRPSISKMMMSTSVGTPQQALAVLESSCPQPRLLQVQRSCYQL